MNLNDAIGEIFPRKVRLVIYVIASLLLLVVTGILSAEGDTGLAIVTILGALQSALAAKNISPANPLQSNLDELQRVANEHGLAVLPSLEYSQLAYIRDHLPLGVPLPETDEDGDTSIEG